MVARLVAVGLIVVALGGCAASAGGVVDGGGTGGGAGAGAGGSSGGAGGGSSGGAGGAIAGTGGGAGGGSSGGAGGAVVVDGGDACASLAGQSFFSVSELPCNQGINPQAPPCHWSVDFTAAGTFFYYEAGGDLAITGTYVCAGGAITGTVAGGALVLHGTYGGSGAELLWDGHQYQL
jgi:hypothetical protein